jgi:hypothetical protein
MDLATTGVYPNALNADTGNPTTWYHGTYGLYALNILTQKHLTHGDIETGGKSGLWHGPPRKAVEYAWPTMWPYCNHGTMTMFELRIAQHTKHATHVYVSRFLGTYEVSAILLQRYRGSLHEAALRRDFNFMRNGNHTLDAMWKQGLREELPPEPLEQPSDIEAKEDQEESEAEEEPDWFTLVSGLRSCLESADTPGQEEKIQDFISRAQALAMERNKPVPSQDSFMRYLHRTPFRLRPGDHRFREKKTERIFACDTCEALVSYSSASRGNAYRADGDFQGAYVDHSWKDLPIELLEEAWGLGLVDVTWKCNAFCEGGITGGGKDRTSRPAAHRAACKKSRSSW